MSSITKDQPNNKHYPSQAVTSQTLTYLNNSQNGLNYKISKPNADIYADSQINEQNILAHTLAHANLEWLTNHLENTRRHATNLIQNRQCNNKVSQFSNNLATVSDTLNQSIKNISQFRKALRNNLQNKFMLRSSVCNLKLRRKSNLFKYRQLLLTVKDLHSRTVSSTYSQSQLIATRNRLKTSGIMLVPTLIEKTLVTIAERALNSKSIVMNLTEVGNLRTIVEWYMDKNVSVQLKQSKLTNSTTIIDDCIDSATKHKTYTKFKKYLNIKNHICLLKQKQQQQCSNGLSKLDELCQFHISQYVEMRLPSISVTQWNKIGSLVQSNKICQQYFVDMVRGKLLDMLSNILQSINNMQMMKQSRCKTINKSIKQLNKKQTPFNKLQLPQIQPPCITMQHIKQMFNKLSQYSNLYTAFRHLYQMRVCFEELAQWAMRQCILAILQPLLTIYGSVLPVLEHAGTAQIRYLYMAIMHRNMQTWQQLLNQQAIANSSSIKKHIEQLINSIAQYNNKIVDNGSNMSANKKNNKSKQKVGKHGKCMKMAEYMISYNQHYGELYVYMANKLSNMANNNNLQQQHQNIDAHIMNENIQAHSQQNKQPSYTKNSNRGIRLDNLVNMWKYILVYPIVMHQVHEMQPANIMKQIKFMKLQILQAIQQIHSAQNQVNHIASQHNHNHNHNQNSKSSKKIKQQLDQQSKQILYSKILSNFNLKVLNYKQLMAVSKAIGVDKEINKMHQHIYEETVSHLNIFHS